MRSLVLKSLAQAVGLVFLVSTLVFVLQALVPGDAARSICGAGCTPAQYEALRERLGLDQPVYVQYAHYLGGLVHGDFGTSLTTGQSVVTIILQRLPVTLSLALLSVVVAMAVGILLGTVAARRRGAAGGTVDVLALAGLALPNFWVALVLVSLFAITIRLFPATGYVSFTTSPAGWLSSLVLPVVALALSGVAVVAKTTRDGMSEVFGRDYIRTLRACGLSERSVVWKHGLKNAAVPLLSVSNLVFIGALGGTVLVESVFALNGLGSLMVTAVSGHEVYEVEGVAIFFTLIVVLVNLLIDLAYGWANPRVRRTA